MMFINSYSDHAGYWVYPSKEVRPFLFVQMFEPTGFRRFLCVAGGMAIALLACGLIFATTGFALWYLFVGAALAGGTISALFDKRRSSPKYLERLRQKGYLSRRDSYAFRRLEKHLATLKIWIGDMNDRIDYEVGMVPISQYLQMVAPITKLIDGGALKKGDELAKEQHEELKQKVDVFAKEAAATIRFSFDQRELKRQAIEAGKKEEAAATQEALDSRLAAYASAAAEVLLITARGL